MTDLLRELVARWRERAEEAKRGKEFTFNALWGTPNGQASPGISAEHTAYAKEQHTYERAADELERVLEGEG